MTRAYYENQDNTLTTEMIVKTPITVIKQGNTLKLYVYDDCFYSTEITNAENKYLTIKGTGYLFDIKILGI